MSTPCLSCKHLHLREHPKHAAAGLGRCFKGPPAFFVVVTSDRPCAKFEAAPAEKVEARVRWNSARLAK